MAVAQQHISKVASLPDQVVLVAVSMALCHQPLHGAAAAGKQQQEL
jgi:hypothetical protein